MAKSAKPRSKKAAKGAEKKPRQSRHQAAAVILFAASLLVLCLLLIPGERAWGALRGVLLGLFGVCAFLLPVLGGYIAVIAARETEQGLLARKAWLGGLALLALCTVIHVFTADVDTGYFPALGQAYTAGIAYHSAGFFGGILGYPFEYLFTDLGAKIILILLAFVTVMLATGTGILSLFRTLWKPVEKTRDSIRHAVDYADEAQEETGKTAEKPAEKAVESTRSAIDVDLGEGYPAFGTVSDAPSAHDPKKNLEKFKKTADGLRQGDRFAYDMPLDGETGSAPKTGQGAPADAVVVQPKGETGGKMELPPLDEAEKKQLDDSLNAAAHTDKPVNVYRYPPLSLLKEAPPSNARAAQEEQQQTASLLVNTLQEFGVSTRMMDVSRGPSVTRYELQPSAGVKISRITGLSDDIALRLATTGVRIEAPIPGKAAVGIEVPNRTRQTVVLREMLDTPAFTQAKGRLTVALGRDIAGKPVYADLAKMPHLLIAGTTGSGKSVCTNAMIQSVLYRSTPQEVRMLLIDPKRVEFGIYNGVPHLLVPVVTDPRKAAGALGWAVTEMLKRYGMFAENNVRDIEAYNALAKKSDTMQTLPLILIVIDELSDLMMSAANEVEDAIVRLAQMARAAGMHLVIATQRPSVDVITGLIKANIPSRLALTVASGVDSRTILDSVGAEKLLGYGDMLFAPVGMAKPMRIQGCFVSDSEVESVVNFLKSSGEEQEYDEGIIAEIDRQAEAAGRSSAKIAGGGDDDGEYEDDMLPQAIQVAVESGSISTSMLQRKLRLGYARAGRIMDMMEQKGIIGPPEGSKPRQVLITRQQWLEMNLNRDDAPVEEEL
ncbi:MAG: DNA translocase FtsK [Acutalibacteraceae bacterium]|jgi:S-DNA-T family DNA segregation ATPase FtsK/SpoIIIE